MKNTTKFIGFLAFLLLFGACDKKEDLKISNINLAGRWICTSQEYKINGNTIHKETYPEEDVWITFEANGGGLLVASGEGLLEINSYGPGRAFNWFIENDMIITDLRGYREFKIKSLSEDKLTLQAEYEEGRSIVAYFKKYISSNDYDNSISASNLIGRWGVIKTYDKSYDEYQTYTLSESGIETGDIGTPYVDFYHNDSGYKYTGMNKVTILGSSTSSFTWKLNGNKIEVYEAQRDEIWKIISFDGLYMTLESEWDKVWLQRVGINM